ncbi:MAG: hypothetical protein LBS03_09300 [Bacteroidales bacterium]|jgi:hypothetical protein|nr:hypothetical protein [Bacteroidales bacterium]
MKLCFGTFAGVMLDNKNNKSANRERVVRKLLTILDNSDKQGEESGVELENSTDISIVYKYLKRERDLPNDLLQKELPIQYLDKQFENYIENYLGLDYDKILSDFFYLIMSDNTLAPSVKAKLAVKTKQAEDNLPHYLAEMFRFVIKHTSNDIVENEGEPIERDLEYEHVFYTEMVRLGVIQQNAEIVDFAIAPLGNHVYRERAVMKISNSAECMKNQKFRDIFHRELSRMVNDNYRFKVINRSLDQSEYFKANADELIDGHIAEIVSEEYTYNILAQLCKMERGDLAVKYAGLLTDEKFKGKLNAVLGE